MCTIPIGMHFQCKLLFINGNVRHRGMDRNKNISYVHLSDIWFYRFGFIKTPRGKHLLQMFTLSTALHIFNQLSFRFSSTTHRRSRSPSRIRVFLQFCKNRQTKNIFLSVWLPDSFPEDAGQPSLCLNKQIQRPSFGSCNM